MGCTQIGFAFTVIAFLLSLVNFFISLFSEKDWVAWHAATWGWGYVLFYEYSWLF